MGKEKKDIDFFSENPKREEEEGAKLMVFLAWLFFCTIQYLVKETSGCVIAKTIIVARVGGGEQKSGLSEKKRVEEKMVFFKKKCSLWIEM